MELIKKKYKYAFIIVVLIICLIILLLYIRKHYTYKNTVNYEDIKNNGLLNLSGIGVFFDQYDGEFKASEVAKKLEDITTIYLPELINTTNEYNEMQLIKYFYENRKSIKETYGIKEYETFVNFVNKINESNVDINEWYRLDVEEETFLNESDKKGYAYVEYFVSMKNDQTLEFSLYVSKSAKKTIPYIVDVIKK